MPVSIRVSSMVLNRTAARAAEINPASANIHLLRSSASSEISAVSAQPGSAAMAVICARVTSRPGTSFSGLEAQPELPCKGVGRLRMTSMIAAQTKTART